MMTEFLFLDELTL